MDSFRDAIHTFIRSVGTILPGATEASSEDPVTCTVIALPCGGVDCTSHFSKAATRLLANCLPEPFTNLWFSFAGDIFIPVACRVLIKHREIALGAMGFPCFCLRGSRRQFSGVFA